MDPRSLALIVKNFRGILEAKVEIAPITLVYGPNGTGKSTLLYAPLVLRNILLNPAQTPAGFFNLQAINLGGLREVTFDRDPTRAVTLGLHLDSHEALVGFEVSLKDQEGHLVSFMQTAGIKIDAEMVVSFPYTGVQRLERRLVLPPARPPLPRVGPVQLVLIWNGLTWMPGAVPEALPEPHRKIAENYVADYVALLNAPFAQARQIGFVPLIRGFRQPAYGTSPLTPHLVVEEEVATLLALDKDLEYAVSMALEEIVGRQFRVRFIPGTHSFSLDTLDRSTHVAVELVNDGFGINQLVYLLARALHWETTLLCIEEPEIHLHPQSIRRLARFLARTAQEKGKRFLISTHSEPLVAAFLAEVAKGRLDPSDLACYASTKEGKVVRFVRKKVTADGQVEDGLGSFMAGEEEVVKALLGMGDEEA